MTTGIYGYMDTLTDKIVYIGQAQDIHVRDLAHRSPSMYSKQVINKVLQNNPTRYTIYVLEKCSTEMLNHLEQTLIGMFNPKFNFTDGGEGTRGHKHSKETIEKMSNAQKGKKHPKERVERMRKAISGEGNPHYGKPRPKDTKIKMCQSRSSTGFFNVSIETKKDYAQGYTYRYSYYEDGKRKYISSTSILKLEKRVKSKNLEWFIVDETKANKILKKELN